MGKNEIVSLGLIYAEPLHAYALDSFIRVLKVDQYTNFSKISIYSTLRRLESEGCIAVKIEKVGNMPERNIYTITEKGKQRLLKEVRENIQNLEVNGHNFALAMLFCYGMPANEIIELLGKRIEKLSNKIDKLKEDYDIAAKYSVYNWKIFREEMIRNIESEIETANKYIKLLQEFPDYYDKKILKLYRYMIRDRRKSITNT